MALLIRTLLAALLALAAALATAADARFMALSYHEVLADHEAMTPTAVRASDLARQFAWLQANGYHPVSVDQILAARAGGPPLPPNAILLSFDDGFLDVYTRAFPLLKLFNYPAVIALVGQWMDVPAGQMVDYDGKPVPRSKFLNWEQVREMQASGLIEVASHSYDLHHGILANPQGNTQPATTTRLYVNGRHEDDTAYLARLRNDLRDSISQHTGKAPRIIVWPYGRSNQAAQEVAAQLGMPIGLTLIDGFNDAATPTAVWKRQLIENSPSLQAFAEMLRVTWDPNPARSVVVDPGAWPPGADGLSPTLDRLLTLSPNIAFVKPAVIRDGREMALFPTTLRPVAADQLTAAQSALERVEAQAKKTKARVKDEKKHTTSGVRSPEAALPLEKAPAPLEKAPRTESYEARRMFDEDALHAFDRSKREVLVYRDPSDEQLHVLYRRKDGAVVILTPR